ncbi:MAG: hypothetical protein ACI4IW_08600 [Oscillospiraceae bacterium]
MKKRFLSMLMALIMVIGLLPMTAFAEGVEAKLADGTKLDVTTIDLSAEAGLIFNCIVVNGNVKTVYVNAPGESVLYNELGGEWNVKDGDFFIINVSDEHLFGMPEMGDTYIDYLEQILRYDGLDFEDMLGLDPDKYDTTVLTDDDYDTVIVICWDRTATRPPKVENFSELSAENGALYTPTVFSNTTFNMVMDAGAEEASFIFKLNDEHFTKAIYNGTEMTAGEDGSYKLTFSADEILEVPNNAASAKKAVTLSNDDGSESTSISFVVYGRNPDLDMPDSVADYLCLGSQYTNFSNQLTGLYGEEPEKSLLGLGYWWSPISLGNFGGYITYYYEDAIEDDPNNPYGIDFIVYGNSNGGSGFSEPGQVYVSEDGENWYALAGSRHFDDETEWNRTVTYSKEDGKFYAESDGEKKEMKNFSDPLPTAANYPLHFKDGEDVSSITASGVWLPCLRNKGDSDGTAFPEWGYADVKLTCANSYGTGTVASISGYARNPYWPQPDYGSNYRNDYVLDVYEFGGDGMDLAWAVDENGQPVTFANGIHYIKIQTASLGLSGAGVGEKSTEVNCLARAKANDSAVGVTAAPSAITVDGKEVKLKNGVYTYSVGVEGEFDVEVAADENANIYINSTRGNVLSFDAVPEHGIVRVIVQEGEKEPVIYYLKIVERTEEVKAVEELISAIGNVTLDSEEAIEAARNAYNALTEDQKSIVENYDVLAAAERTLAMLKNRDTVTIVIGSKDYTEADGEVNPETGAPVLNLGVLAALCGAAVLIKFNRQ